MRAGLCAGLLLGVALVATASSVRADPTFVVNSVLDVPASVNVTDGVCETGPGNGVCTLRAAIMEANAVVGGGATIELPAGTFFLTRAGAGEDGSVTGDLDVAGSMTIVGRGPAATVLDGNLFDRLFDVRATATQVTIRDLLVQRGDAKGGKGGGILNAGTLSLVNVHVTHNGNFGGVVTSGTLTVDRSVIADNSSFTGGAVAGGLTVQSGGSALVVDSWIRNNVGNDGGGVLNVGALRIERTMIRGNEARFVLGSGINHVGPQLTVVNSTLSENVVNGGLYVDGVGSAEVVQSSILHNAADSNVLGGIMVTGTAANRLVLRSSLVAGNTAGGLARDCAGGAIVSGDYDLIGARSTCILSGPLTHVNAIDFPFSLLPRTWNGGFSLDQGVAGVELDQIPAAACTDDLGAPLLVDQRGFVRDGLCDVGAIESSRGFLPPQLLGGQLIRNGGAEGEELGVASVSPVALPAYWIASEPGFMTAIRYGEAGGYPLASEAPPGSGSTFFGGGNTPFSGGSQRIDVSAVASQIDAGGVEYTASGAFGGFLTDDDRASLTVTFQDETGLDLGSVILGGFTASDRGNLTGLIPDTRVGPVPLGTRIIDVRLEMTRAAGASNDGYADDLSLVLPEPSSGATLLTGLTALGLFGTRGRRTGVVATRARRGPGRPTAPYPARG